MLDWSGADVFRGLCGPNPGVDLHVQMPEPVTGSRRVVQDSHSLEPLDRHLHLSTPWTRPRRGVLG